MMRPSYETEAIPARIRFRLRTIAPIAAGTRSTPAANRTPSATSVRGIAALSTASAPASSSSRATGR